MKITGIRLYEVELGIKLGDYQFAGGNVARLISSIIAVDTDAGHTGWGEICPFGPKYAPALPRGVRPVLNELAPVLLGRDPRMIGEIHAAMDRAVEQQFYVKTGIDYACWDLLGKSAGLPVYALLGGKLTAKLPLIASVPSGSEAMQAAMTHYQNLGYRQFSLHIASPEPNHLAACRQVIESLAPGAIVVIDGNRSWDAMTAIRICRDFEDLDVFVESPHESIAQCGSLRRKIRLPMVLDEQIVTSENFITAAAQGIPDAIHLKIGRVGGLSKAKLICDAADALGIPYWIKDIAGSEIATAATAHLSHSRSPRQLIGTLSCIELVDKRTCNLSLDQSDGYMHLNDFAPGLGVEPDMGVLGDVVAHFR